MWNCPSCDERIDDQFDACWRCGTMREDVPPQEPTSHDLPAYGIGDGEPGDTLAHPPESTLEQILQVQQRQQQVLQDIQFKVGCLFAYMLLGIFLGILAALVSFADW